MNNHMLLSINLFDAILGQFTTPQGIVTFLIFLLVTIGFIKFWEKLGVKFLLPFLGLIFMYSNWGVIAYNKMTGLINESFQMVSGLVTLPKWTISIQTIVFFLSFAFFLYLGYNLFIRIINGTAFFCYIVMYGLLYYLGTRSGAQIFFGQTSNIKYMLQCSIFSSVIENVKQLKPLVHSGMSVTIGICFLMIVGISFILMLLCWKMARSYDWCRIKDDNTIKWYQIILFILLIVRPMIGFILIGLLPFQYHAFRIKNSSYRRSINSDIQKKDKQTELDHIRNNVKQNEDPLSEPIKSNM